VCILLRISIAHSVPVIVLGTSFSISHVFSITKDKLQSIIALGVSVLIDLGVMT